MEKTKAPDSFEILTDEQRTAVVEYVRYELAIGVETMVKIWKSHGAKFALETYACCVVSRMLDPNYEGSAKLRAALLNTPNGGPRS